MYIDTQETFSQGQALATATGDLVSTNIFDTGSTADVGIGEPMFLYVRIGTAVAGVGSTTQVVLQTDDNSSFSSPKEFTVTGALAPAALTANTVIARFRLPIGLERYLRVVYRVAGAAVSAGTADAYLTLDVPANNAYPSGFAVA